MAIPGLPPPSPHASERSRKWQLKNPLRMVGEMLNPTDEIIEEWTVALIEAFTPQDLSIATFYQYDVLPLLQERSLAEHMLAGPIVRMLIRRHWRTHIYPRLSNPGLIISTLYQREPEKAMILGMPWGRQWLDWNCYNLLIWFLEVAKPEGTWKIPPPPGPCPLKPLPGMEEPEPPVPMVR